MHQVDCGSRVQLRPGPAHQAIRRIFARAPKKSIKINWTVWELRSVVSTPVTLFVVSFALWRISWAERIHFKRSSTELLSRRHTNDWRNNWISFVRHNEVVTIRKITWKWQSGLFGGARVCEWVLHKFIIQTLTKAFIISFSIRATSQAVRLHNINMLVILWLLFAIFFFCCRRASRYHIEATEWSRNLI